MSKSTPPNPLSASTPTALSGYPGSAAYATPTSTPGSMHPLQTPTQGTFPHSHNNKHDSVMSMFAPMQSMPNFSGTPPSFSKPPSLALQVSEPEACRCQNDYDHAQLDSEYDIKSPMIRTGNLPKTKRLRYFCELYSASFRTDSQAFSPFNPSPPLVGFGVTGRKSGILGFDTLVFLFSFSFLACHWFLDLCLLFAFIACS